MFFSSICAYSQITLDFQSPLSNLYLVKLTDTETKYYYLNQTALNSSHQFSLYNLDGTHFKTINMPIKPDPSAIVYWLGYISRTLFDNDPSNIEYLVYYVWDSAGQYNYYMREVKVIREDGFVLLDELYGDLGGIFSTEEGTKLQFNDYHYANGTPFSNLTKVFNLPGEFPTSTVDGNSIVESSLSLFPNPNNGSFYIKFNTENKENFIIELYSFSGKLLDSFISTTYHTQIKNLNFPSGMYFLNAKTTQGNQLKSFIIQK